MDDQIRYLLEKMHRLQRVRESLVLFSEEMRESGIPEFEHPYARHHEVVAEHLEKVEFGEINQLMLNLPPGAGKSQMMSVHYPLWKWLRNPKSMILSVSHNERLSNRFNRARRTAVASQSYRRLSGVSLGDKTNESEFNNSKHGVMYAFSMTSGPNGNRCDVLLIDDPIKDAEQAESFELLEKQYRFFKTVLRQRKRAGAPEIICMTRWSENDLCGKLLRAQVNGDQGERWELVRMPLDCDDPINDPLGRSVGESLWPGYWTEQELIQKRSDPLVYQTLMQQLPVHAEGSWLGDPSYIHVSDQAPALA